MPVRTTAPVKSATKAERGAAASSLGVPSCTTRPSSIIPTRSPSCAASAKSWVTSSVGASLVAEHGAELARRGGARAGVERRQRLVEEQDLGLAGERPCDSATRWRSPPLACGPGVGAVGQPEAVEQRRARARAARLAAARAAGRRRSARRSGAGTARSPGRRSRSGGARAARRCRASVSSQVSPWPRRGRARGAAARPPRAGCWSCRRPTGRRARGTRPGATSSSTSRARSPSAVPRLNAQQRRAPRRPGPA